MRKWLRISFIVSGSLLGVLIVLWLGLALYIRHNKAFILQQISTVLSNRLHGGELQIRDMEPSLIHSFPNVSVTLEDVTMRDSLWNAHGHDLLNVSRVFIKVNTFSLLKKQLDIKRISLVSGSIFLYTDSTGYRNTAAMGRQTKTSTSKGRAADITGLELERYESDNR